MDKAEFEKAKFDHRSKAVITSYEAAARVQADVIRMLFLFNGGALVALLALMGAVAKSGAFFPDILQDIVTMFGRGLVAAVVAAFCSWAFIDLQSGRLHGELIAAAHEQRSTLRDGWGRFLAGSGVVIAIVASLWCGVTAMNMSATALSQIAKTIPPVAVPSKP